MQAAKKAARFFPLQQRSPSHSTHSFLEGHPNPSSSRPPDPAGNTACRRAKALGLASALSASKVVTMANAEGDFSGPLRNVVTEGGTLEEFLELARAKGVTAVVPEAGKAVDVWP